eukprot:1227628-Prymnesium_polylepis.1
MAGGRRSAIEPRWWRGEGCVVDGPASAVGLLAIDLSSAAVRAFSSITKPEWCWCSSPGGRRRSCSRGRCSSMRRVSCSDGVASRIAAGGATLERVACMSFRPLGWLGATFLTCGDRCAGTGGDKPVPLRCTAGCTPLLPTPSAVSAVSFAKD